MGRLVVDRQMALGRCELGVDVTAGMQAVVANLGEPVRQHVEEETSNEFHRSHGDLLAVLGAEADAVGVERNQPVVRDAHAMRVLAEILEDLFGPGEWTLGVAPPQFFP